MTRRQPPTPKPVTPWTEVCRRVRVEKVKGAKWLHLDFVRPPTPRTTATKAGGVWVPLVEPSEDLVSRCKQLDPVTGNPRSPNAPKVHHHLASDEVLVASWRNGKLMFDASGGGE